MHLWKPTICTLALALACTIAGATAQQRLSSSYLFVWAGDADRKNPDFLAVMDSDPTSPTYTHVLRTVPVNESGTNPHHSEHVFSPGHPLFVSGFAGNRIYRIDLGNPLQPRLLGDVDRVPTLNFAHNFERLPNGNVLATMQSSDRDGHGAGGLMEFRDDGAVVRHGTAVSPDLEQAHPYSLLILSDKDRIITSSACMGLPDWDDRRAHFTHEAQGTHIQLWRLSDLRLLKTVTLQAPSGTRVNVNPYEPRRLPSGDVLLSSGSGGLYRITGLDSETFDAEFVYNFESRGSAVPVLSGNFWVQPLGEKRQVVALDVTDPRRPRLVSALQFDSRQSPHWLGLEPSHGRIVVANSGPGEYRLWMIRLDPKSGELSFDTSFHEPGSDRLGISFDRQQWPHGETGPAIPHGSVFNSP